jgi:large subunit ribosomal protein L24
VLRVIADKNRVVIEGVNLIKRHTRPNPQKNIKGGIVEREAPIHASNVMLLDPDSNEPTRIGSKRLADGRRVRISRKSGATVDQ